MEATRREFLFGTLGVALASKLEGAEIWQAPNATQAANSGRQAPYGSSNFGIWIDDEFGLPAFQYTCNQTSDPRAVTQLQPGILAPTEHIHQVGNDRITALASNFGHVRVRQDEGSPKFLNDVDAEMTSSAAASAISPTATNRCPPAMTAATRNSSGFLVWATSAKA